jgi:hypothetical protein
MTKIATKLYLKDYILRSGAAVGADSAFEQGAGLKKEIYLATDYVDTTAINIAKQFHPAWNRISSEYVRRLHGRNTYQILGRDLVTPVKFVICWTPDGCITHDSRTINTGGTGTAISIAHHYHIPIFNLAISSHLERLTNYVGEV